jgi:hypothetical protein
MTRDFAIKSSILDFLLTHLSLAKKYSMLKMLHLYLCLNEKEIKKIKNPPKRVSYFLYNQKLQE